MLANRMAPYARALMLVLGCLFALPLAGANAVPDTGVEHRKVSESRSTGATPLQAWQGVGIGGTMRGELPLMAFAVPIASPAPGMGSRIGAANELGVSQFGPAQNKALSEAQQAAEMKLPEPGGWSSALATFALVLFFFVRRLT